MKSAFGRLPRPPSIKLFFNLPYTEFGLSHYITKLLYYYIPHCQIFVTIMDKQAARTIRKWGSSDHNILLHTPRQVQNCAVITMLKWRWTHFHRNWMSWKDLSQLGLLASCAVILTLTLFRRYSNHLHYGTKQHVLYVIPYCTKLIIGSMKIYSNFSLFLKLQIKLIIGIIVHGILVHWRTPPP